MFRITTSLHTPAIVSATLFAATAAIDIPHTQHQPFTTVADYALELLFAAALVSASVACHVWTCLQPGRGARIAVGTAASGFGFLGISALATAARGQDSLGPVFLLGLVLLLGAAVSLLVLDLRRRLAPRFAGITFALGMVAMLVLGEGYGVLAWTASWAAVAALSQVGRREPVAA
jgi:tellurite resistance protein TehA-like permease